MLSFVESESRDSHAVRFTPLREGVGGFDIMATPYGPKDDPSWPGHLSAWSKIEVGWLVPTEILEDGVYSIEASELAPQARVIKSPYPFMEYLLIENRQPLAFDARLWTGGLVVYHIDDRAPRQQDRGYPGQEGWPRNGYEIRCRSFVYSNCKMSISIHKIL